MFGSTDQEIGKVRVAPVVLQGLAVETRDVETGSSSHGRGCRGVPLVLASGVGLDISLVAYYGHGLGSG